jgi:hypothetical protein
MAEDKIDRWFTASLCKNAGRIENKQTFFKTPSLLGETVVRLFSGSTDEDPLSPGLCFKKAVGQDRSKETQDHRALILRHLPRMM